MYPKPLAYNSATTTGVCRTALFARTARHRHAELLPLLHDVAPGCCCSRNYTDYENFVGRWTEGQGWYVSALQADKIAGVTDPSKVMMCLVGGGCPYNGADEPTGEQLTVPTLCLQPRGAKVCERSHCCVSWAC